MGWKTSKEERDGGVKKQAIGPPMSCDAKGKLFRGTSMKPRDELNA